MDREFWIKKWQTPKPGFHQEKVNSRLKKYWSSLNLKEGKVFVPLCGSTEDMLWLMETGHQVIGVEFSEVACEKFFHDHKIDFELFAGERFNCFRSADIELWQGDFFSMRLSDLYGIKGVYDRASLIALPPRMRHKYACHMSDLLPCGTQVFLISMDYDERKMEGPPFSVDEQEVRTLFDADFSVEIITRSVGPDIVGNLAARGLDTLRETVYLLTKG